MIIDELFNHKMGYNLHDKKEFELVRNYIISNGYSVKNFDKNLNDLVLEDDSKSMVSSVAQYNPITNKISGRASGADFVHELVHMSSNICDGHDELGAKYRDGSGYSLNEGITEFITLDLLPNQKNAYPFQVLFVECLYQMYPELVDEIKKKYFIGKPQELYNLFKEDKEVILNAVRELDKFSLDYKNNTLVTMDVLAKQYGIDQKIGLNVSDHVSNGKQMNEELANAFSILVNNYKSKNSYNTDLVEYMMEDFEDTSYAFFGDEIADELMEMFNEKIIRGKTL